MSEVQQYEVWIGTQLYGAFEKVVLAAEYELLRAELAAIKAGQGEAVAYRYKEGHSFGENEKPWVPTTLAHGAVLLERKELAANGTFKGDERDHYLALAVEPLYAAQPATGVIVPRELLVRHLNEIGEYAWAENTDEQLRALLAQAQEAKP